MNLKATLVYTPVNLVETFYAFYKPLCSYKMQTAPTQFNLCKLGSNGTIGNIVVLTKSYYRKQSCHWRQVFINSRKFNQQLWRKIFYTLLNIPSCEEIPDLSALRRECEEYFVSSLLPTYNKQINKVILKLDSLASKWVTIKNIYVYICITNHSTKSSWN